MFKALGQLFASVIGLLGLFDKVVEAGNNLADVGVSKSLGYKENEEYGNNIKRLERIVEFNKRRKDLGLEPLDNAELKDKFGLSQEDLDALSKAK